MNKYDQVLSFINSEIRDANKIIEDKKDKIKLLEIRKESECNSPNQNDLQSVHTLNLGRAVSLLHQNNKLKELIIPKCLSSTLATLGSSGICAWSISHIISTINATNGLNFPAMFLASISGLSAFVSGAYTGVELKDILKDVRGHERGIRNVIIQECPELIKKKKFYNRKDLALLETEYNRRVELESTNISLENELDGKINALKSEIVELEAKLEILECRRDAVLSGRNNSLALILKEDLDKKMNANFEADKSVKSFGERYLLINKR